MQAAERPHARAYAANTGTSAHTPRTQSPPRIRREHSHLRAYAAYHSHLRAYAAYHSHLRAYAACEQVLTLRVVAPGYAGLGYNHREHSWHVNDARRRRGRSLGGEEAGTLGGEEAGR